MTRSRKRKLARMRELVPGRALVPSRQLAPGRELAPGRGLARARGKWVGFPLASALLAGGGIAAPAPDADQGMLEDVVVTAQKRTEDLQRVPISLQVLSGEMLQEHQVT